MATVFIISYVPDSRRKGTTMIYQKPDSSLTRQVLTGLILAALLILPVTATSIDPIGDYAVGNHVTISGSTSVAIGGKVWVDVSASDFHPTSKYESIEQLSGESKSSGTARVTKGTRADGQNAWSVNFSTAGWKPVEYTVRVADETGEGPLLWASSTFRLAPSAENRVTPVASVAIADPTAPVVPTTKAPLPALVTAGALAVAIGFVGLLRR